MCGIVAYVGSKNVAPLLIEGLKPNTKYIVRVRAVNSCGNSPWSKGHQGTFKTLEA